MARELTRSRLFSYSTGSGYDQEDHYIAIFMDEHKQVWGFSTTRSQDIPD